MGIYEARHQHAAVSGNDADVNILIDGDRAGGYALDGVAFNQHIGGSRERVAFAVEDAHILEECFSAIDRYRRSFRTRRLQVVVLRQAHGAGATQKRCQGQ